MFNITREVRGLDRLSKLQQEKAGIERQMSRLGHEGNQDARKRDTRRKIIAGAIVLKHAQTDPEFAAVLDDLLGRFVLERDRHLFGLEDRSRFASAFMQAAIGDAWEHRSPRTSRGRGIRGGQPYVDV